MKTLYDHLLHTFVLCCLMSGSQARQYSIPPRSPICSGGNQANQQNTQSAASMPNQALIDASTREVQAEAA